MMESRRTGPLRAGAEAAAGFRAMRRRFHPWKLAWLLVLVARPGPGQDDAARRHERAIDHLKKTAAELSARSLSDVRSLDDWKEKRPGLRRELLYMLGLDPLPGRSPLQAEVRGVLERPVYRVEKVVFQSLPGLFVTANLYLPAKAPHPLPAVLYVCGHSPHPLGAKWAYQDRAAWFAEQGFACFILDTLEFGEVPGLHHGIHDLNLWDWLSRGYTPAGVEVWNAMRAIDYLESRAEIDPRRIGMTGISGGGATTWFTAAVDERIAAAAPVCSTYTLGSQALHWTAAGQCDCIYFHNTFLRDFPVVGALIAPRPLLILSGRKDGDFPPDGYEEVFRRTKTIYDLHAGAGGPPDAIRNVDGDAGHSDTPLLRKEAREWMRRWLQGDGAPVAIEEIPAEPRETAEALACLGGIPAASINERVHELLIPTAPAGTWATAGEWQGRRRELIDGLREKVFRWFPRERIPFETRVTSNDGGWSARYADFKEVIFDTEPGVPIRARILKPRKISKDTPLLLHVKRPGDSIYPYDLDELLPLLGRYTVVILNPRFSEHPVSAFEHAEIERTASWVGRTVGSMQVWDILRAVEWLVAEEKVPAASITVHGKGSMGILALHAALLDARIERIVLRDPPGSHLEGPALLNVLRVTDIPEAAGAFAPRSLVFVGKIPAAFEPALAIYALEGRRDRVTSAASLPAALEVWKY